MGLTCKLYVLLGILVLTGCGDDGDGTSPVSAPLPTPVPTAPSPDLTAHGVYSAPLVAASRGLYLGLAQESIFRVDTFTQDSASGLVTKINDITLSGDGVKVHDISGDANYAQGRWAGGTVTYEDRKPFVLSPYGGTVHYLLTKDLYQLPTSGVFTCSPGRFTTPTYVGFDHNVARGDDRYATVIGTATLTFNDQFATIRADIQITNSTNTVQEVYKGDISSPAALKNVSGLSFGNTAYMWLGDADGGEVLVGLRYNIKFDEESQYRYHGIASWSCSPPAKG